MTCIGLCVSANLLVDTRDRNTGMMVSGDEAAMQTSTHDYQQAVLTSELAVVETFGTDGRAA